MIEGEISYNRGLNREFINRIKGYSKEEGFQLEKETTIIKLSAIESTSPEIWVTLKITGEVFGIWVANKFLDFFWGKIQNLIKKIKENEHIIPLIKIEGVRNLIINPYTENENNFREAMGKLNDYLNNNPQIEGWQWYNEEKKEWGDINKVMEWKKEELEKNKKK